MLEDLDMADAETGEVFVDRGYVLVHACDRNVLVCAGEQVERSCQCLPHGMYVCVNVCVWRVVWVCW